ncbi:MAG: LamG domain-containing protein [Polyangiales bacterium]|nr:LamG domain-containing protein [Myxococcales bacterium]
MKLRWGVFVLWVSFSAALAGCPASESGSNDGGAADGQTKDADTPTDGATPDGPGTSNDSGTPLAECNDFILDDDFESNDVDDAPSGWSTACFSGQPYEATVSDDSYDGDRAMHIEFAGGNAESAVFVPVAWPRGGIVRVSMRIRPGTDDQNIYILPVHDDERIFNAVPFQHTGKLMDGSTNYDAGTWYRLDYLMDFDDDRFEMFVDGVLVEDGPFDASALPCTPTGNGDYLLFAGGYVDQKWNAEVDDVEVRTITSLVETYDGEEPPCPTSLLDCAFSCDDGDSDCVEDCVSAESSNCGKCINNNPIACANENGCQLLWDNYECCVAAECPTGKASCIDKYCKAEAQAYDNCSSEAYDGVCEGTTTACIASSCSVLSPNTQARSLVTDTTGLFPSTMTYEMWVRFDSFDSTDPAQYILQAEAADHKLLYLRAFMGNLECVIGTGAGETRVQYALSSLSTNTWYHVACTRSSSQLALWVDGEKRDSDAGSPYAKPPDGTPLSFGGDSRTPPVLPAFKGAVDEVRISNKVRYTTAFTPKGRLVADANTVAVWNFDECDGTTAKDSVDDREATLDYGATWIEE